MDFEKIDSNDWRSLSNGKIIDPAPYLDNWVSQNPGYKIYIGCDSSNLRKKTTFATVIVLHRDGKGGHVIFNRITEEKIKSRYERLWKEVELSVSASHLLEKWGLGKPDFIDIDINPDPKYKSNFLLASAVGMIESLGVNARSKTKSPWAISIADSLCRL